MAASDNGRRRGPVPEGWSEALRWAYLIVPFVVAVRLRLGEPGDLGLRLPGWPEALFALGLVGVVVAATAATGRLFERASGSRRTPSPGLGRHELGLLALKSLAVEAHWAFIRSAPLSIGLDSVGLAVMLGLGLLALEAWSDPERRMAFHEPKQALWMSRGAALAVLSAAVFLATGSTPACMGAHLLGRGSLVALGYLPEPRAEWSAATLGDAEPTVV